MRKQKQASNVSWFPVINSLPLIYKWNFVLFSLTLCFRLVTLTLPNNIKVYIKFQPPWVFFKILNEIWYKLVTSSIKDWKGIHFLLLILSFSAMLNMSTRLSCTVCLMAKTAHSKGKLAFCHKPRKLAFWNIRNNKKKSSILWGMPGSELCSSFYFLKSFEQSQWQQMRTIFSSLCIFAELCMSFLTFNS